MLKFLLDDHREIEILRTVDPALPRPESLSICLAKTNEDYLAAAQLLYKSYQRRGIRFVHESELRVIPQVMTPTTAIVIVRSGATVIATATVVCSNAFDFPISEILMPNERTEFLNEKNGGVCEIASLAIADKYLAPASGVFYLLVGYLHEYCVNHLGIKKIVIGAQPAVVNFYRAMFGFTPIGDGKARAFNSAGGDLTVPMIVIAEKFVEKIRANGKRLAKLKPLVKLFLEDPKTDASYEYTEVEDRQSFMSKSVSLLEELFLKQTDIMRNIDPTRRAKVEAMYPTDDDFKWVFQLDPRLSRRRVRRFNVSLPTTIAVRSNGNGTTTHTGVILDISETGAQVTLDNSQTALPTNAEVTLTISVSETTETSVHGEVIRRDPDMRSYGIRITDCGSTFLEFLRTLANQKAA